MPSTEPIERSTFRVTTTMVSPIASRATIAAPESSCWTLVALRKRWLSIVVAPTTITSARTMPSSRKRNRSSATWCELARGRVTFCSSRSVVTRLPRPCRWQPARARPDRVRQLAVLQLQPQRPVPRKAPLGTTWDEPGTTQAIERREHDVALDLEVHHQPLLAPVFGNEADAGGHRLRRRTRRQRRSVDLDRPCVPAVDPEDRARDLGPAGADEARKGDDLAATHLERDVGEHALARQPLDLQHDPARLGRHRREQRIHVTADHRADDGLDRQLHDLLRQDVAAVAHHRDALTDREDLFEPVRHEQHRVS